jgi:hypothetical protein
MFRGDFEQTAASAAIRVVQNGRVLGVPRFQTGARRGSATASIEEVALPPAIPGCASRTRRGSGGRRAVAVVSHEGDAAVTLSAASRSTMARSATNRDRCMRNSRYQRIRRARRTAAATQRAHAMSTARPKAEEDSGDAAAARSRESLIPYPSIFDQGDGRQDRGLVMHHPGH